MASCIVPVSRVSVRIAASVFSRNSRFVSRPVWISGLSMCTSVSPCSFMTSPSSASS
ncbi:hypothetical protein EVA_13803 [gut metagenome]|uniref:Uncharacterized protein n=1 Tax=gut metagenome TaxID=749906 RepID=J9G8K7_9ZZZZ